MLASNWPSRRNSSSLTIPTNFLQQPSPVMLFNNDYDAYMILWTVMLPDRWVAQREIWYDRKTKLALYARAGIGLGALAASVLGKFSALHNSGRGSMARISIREQAARLAGEKALHALLKGVAKENQMPKRVSPTMCNQFPNRNNCCTSAAESSRL
jgi:hypothetical protein